MFFGNVCKGLLMISFQSYFRFATCSGASLRLRNTGYLSLYLINNQSCSRSNTRLDWVWVRQPCVFKPIHTGGGHTHLCGPIHSGLEGNDKVIGMWDLQNETDVITGRVFSLIVICFIIRNVTLQIKGIVFQYGPGRLLCPATKICLEQCCIYKYSFYFLKRDRFDRLFLKCDEPIKLRSDEQTVISIPELNTTHFPSRSDFMLHKYDFMTAHSKGPMNNSSKQGW